jgi:thiol-disulfide isomerase/thioredoxin
MKRTLLFSTLFLFWIKVGYTQNLTIIKEDYQKARIESERQKKMLIIDFYTTWCGPCKMLDNAIFYDSTFNKKLAKNFVLLKYNAEKDSVFNIALKHHINLYPTNIILNSDGFVLHRMNGTGTGDIEKIPDFYSQFIEKAISLDNNKEYIKGVSNSTNLNYPSFLFEIKDKKEKRIEAIKFLKNSKDKFSEEFFILLALFNNDTSIQDFVLENRVKYENLFGKLDLQNLTRNIIYGRFYNAIELKDANLFEKAKKLSFENLEESEAKDMIKSNQNLIDIALGNFEKTIKSIKERKAINDIDGFGINQACWRIYGNCNDKNILRECATLMKALTEEQPNFAKIDTYARILYKLGDLEEAKLQMKKGINLGKTNNEDVREGEEWLKNIK